MFSPWVTSEMMAIGAFGRLDSPLNSIRLALREPIVGQRKRGGKDRDKVKAARKQNRRNKK